MCMCVSVCNLNAHIHVHNKLRRQRQMHMLRLYAYILTYTHAQNEICKKCVSKYKERLLPRHLCIRPALPPTRVHPRTRGNIHPCLQFNPFTQLYVCHWCHVVIVSGSPLKTCVRCRNVLPHFRRQAYPSPHLSSSVLLSAPVSLLTRLVTAAVATLN